MERIATPYGVVVISQTCDVVRSVEENPTIQVAAVVSLEGTTAAEARDQRRPRYVHIPALGDFFADLQVVATIHKRILLDAGSNSVTGCRDDDEARVFGAAVGRRFSRFPFPDEVADQIAGLTDSIKVKYSRPASPLGQVLRRVLEIRLQASTSWADPECEIQLVVVCQPGVLPTIDDTPPVLPVPLRRRLRLDSEGISALNAGDIAQVLEEAYGRADPIAIHFGWFALVNKWAAQCNEVIPTHGTRRAHNFVAELADAEDFPLTRVRESEILDVDYLSGPTLT
jgi:hypothetical protein